MKPAKRTIVRAPAESTERDKMVTLVCSSCKMALYMSERVLHLPTWKCPACGAVTKTTPEPRASLR